MFVSCVIYIYICNLRNKFYKGQEGIKEKKMSFQQQLENLIENQKFLSKRFDELFFKLDPIRPKVGYYNQ